MTLLSDGEWHRLHPATPLFKGGIALIAIIGVVLVNLRDILIESVIGGEPGEEGDFLNWVVERNLLWVGIAALVLGLALFVAGFYFSWRMHTFRITQEVVEVRSGILFRTNRKARLDRIQGINIVRPFIARLFGAAKLEVNVAGQDANVQLSYLTSGSADALRREILRLASGTQAGDQPTSPVAPAGSIIEQRVAELLAPELDPDAAPPQSVVTMNLGRLIGSILLSGFTVFIILLVAGGVVAVTMIGDPLFLVGLAAPIIGVGSYYVSKFTRSLRYSIAGTPDGVRVGFGLLSTSNETLPPGRIHSIQVSQPLLWRPAGWWEVKVNRASTSSAKGAAGQANTTILPVGNLTDVSSVLGLILPQLVDENAMAIISRGLTSSGGEDGFSNSPRRAAVLRWFSWRRNGFAITPDAVLLRSGSVWRWLVIVPQARIQSVSLRQGPILRGLKLGTLHVHTVSGPISARLGAVDREAAVHFFRQVAHSAVTSAQTDTSHRWRRVD